MSEEQPNVRPYENVSGDVELVKRMDPVNVVCTRCRRAVSVSKDPAKATASHLVKCDGFCRYSVCHSASVALGEVPAKPSTFKVIYDEVLVELAVSVRKNKGVSSDRGDLRQKCHVIFNQNKKVAPWDVVCTQRLRPNFAAVCWECALVLSPATLRSCRGVFGTPNPSASALPGAMLGAAAGGASAGSVALRSASRTPLR